MLLLSSEKPCGVFHILGTLYIAYNRHMNYRQAAIRMGRLLGPAFVAAVAYVDPGNFAANFGAGAGYGYLLLWVLIVANLMAGLAQYLSAKVGIVTGRSLPEIIAARLPRWGRHLYWAQAELVAIATDVAEVVGGAVALNLLFGISLPVGGLIIGFVSMLLLAVYSQKGQRRFEQIIIALLLLIPIGFIVGLIQHPPSFTGIAEGLIPRFGGSETLLLASAMVGATIMPHVVYLHSALARDRHGKVKRLELQRYLRATKVDVVLAMAIAGTVNVAMLVLAAATLSGTAASFDDIFRALNGALGPLVGILFAVGLLISGLASTAVGSQAGGVIMHDFLQVHMQLWVRRLLTMMPAVVLLFIGINPLLLLVISQVALSIGVPFALIPLAIITSRRSVMGDAVNTRVVTVAIYGIAIAVSALNAVLLYMTIAG